MKNELSIRKIGQTRKIIAGESGPVLYLVTVTPFSTTRLLRADSGKGRILSSFCTASRSGFAEHRKAGNLWRAGDFTTVNWID